MSDVNFAAYFDLNNQPKKKILTPEVEIKSIDKTKYKKSNKSVDFGIQIKSESEVRITEACYRAAIPIIITEADINRWILSGCPMY